MGGVNVKITMIERVLQLVAPHPCSGCAKVGTLLCHNCKNNIIEEPFFGCILCGKPKLSGICDFHQTPLARAFTVGSRTGTLEILINKYKFEHAKAAVFPLAELLDETLPVLPSGIEIIPIPTVRSHIRERGYDQVDLLARQFGSLRNIPITRAITRRNKATQHKVGKNEREAQAGAAFVLPEGYSLQGKVVLLLDDVVTTGATLQAAATLLQGAGATVWAASLAYQPLD
jgi:competence protein ComFC